uniref:Uncharacterized protein n=1 Tax=Lactuca sativa TaxID=4236 RepID=A0A9R1WJD4_LACSA|nr:hypothetical protein LSAT_V11C100035740 [Lactuca sativa]
MDSGSDDDLVLHTLLSGAQDVVHERGETSHRDKKHRKWINRDQEAANELLKFIFTYSYKIGTFFQLRWDARSKCGFTTIQKYMAALKQLTYGITADASNEYLKMSERMCRECIYHFFEYVIELYSDIYWRHLTKSDVEQLYAAHQAKYGFQWMFGSIICTH